MRYLMFLAILLSGCATYHQSTYRLLPSTETPAAAGNIVASEDINGNISIRLNIENFAQPKQVDCQQRYIYVVWIDPGDGFDEIPVAQFEVDEDGKASVIFITPFRVFDVLITTEAKILNKPSNVILAGRIWTKNL